MTDNSIWGGAALMGVMAACLQTVRAWLWKLASLPVQRAVVTETLADSTAAYLWSHFKCLPFSERMYSSQFKYIRQASKMRHAVYEFVGRDTIIFRQGWRFMLVKFQNSGSDSPSSGLVLTCLRGSFDFEKLLRQVAGVLDSRADVINESFIERDRFAIYWFTGNRDMFGRDAGAGKDPSPNARSPSAQQQPPDWAVRFLHYSRDEMGEPSRPGELAFSNLAFPPEVMEIKQDIEQWKLSQEWYLAKGIPWRRGWQIQGPPGTGKSALAKALAQSNKLPLFSFDLGSMTNTDFRRYWSEARAQAPCLVLMEDFDNVFHGRENIQNKDGHGISFDCLLNTMSGVDNSDGVFTIITTNYPEHIDEALGVASKTKVEGQLSLSSRPGRIDRVLRLEAPNVDCLRQIARRILSDCPDEIEPAVKLCLGLSGAQFQDYCRQIALDHRWNRR